MSSQTPNLGLTLPIGTEKVSRQIINDNMTLIDQYCGAIHQATYRPIPVTITVADWTQSGGNWVYTFNTAYITATSDEWFAFSSSIESAAKAHIKAVKKTGGGGAVFTTAIKPTGTVECMIRVFDNEDGKLPYLMEGTVLPYANGGTNASTLNGAKENLGINALTTQIANMATAKVTGTMANAVDTYASASYPSGFTADNCAIIGVIVKTSSNSWYSNNPNITCMGDTSLGIRIKTSDSGFVGQPFVILLMKIPS